MRSERVQNDLGATAGLRYRNGRPRTSFTERVSGGGEPDAERSDQGTAAAFGGGKATLAEIAHLSLPKMLSGANAFEISNIQ